MLRWELIAIRISGHCAFEMLSDQAFGLPNTSDVQSCGYQNHLRQTKRLIPRQLTPNQSAQNCLRYGRDLPQRAKAVSWERFAT